MKKRAVYVKPKTEILQLYDDVATATDVVSISLTNSGDSEEGPPDIEW